MHGSKEGRAQGHFILMRSYWTDPWSLFLIEVVLVQFAELRRWQDYRTRAPWASSTSSAWRVCSAAPATPPTPVRRVLDLGSWTC